MCDSYENITHSLCTLEFESRHASYDWVVNALKRYRSFVWEYGRLALTHTMTSKRKLRKLIMGKFVNGWDDPRLPTLFGMRRLGYPPEAINNFCAEVGVASRTGVCFDIEHLEQFVRKHLEIHAFRKFAVMDPIKLVITNWDGGVIEVEAPNAPDKKKGMRKMPFSKTIYIERSDFRKVDDPDFYGLALETTEGKKKLVRLLFANKVIYLTKLITDGSGNTVSLEAEILNTRRDKGTVIKGNIHWVAEPAPGQEPLKAELRLFGRLFTVEKPTDNWLEEFNKDSLEVVTAYVEPSTVDVKHLEKVQFERKGYYCCDPDSTPEKLVFNRTVTLKSKWKPKKN